ncbi:hypothetical protein RP20_CCG006531 [Aedes albopictus]|nr:hypothetical protein RP20_CCG006531 [Aedes albopictus]
MESLRFIFLLTTMALLVWIGTASAAQGDTIESISNMNSRIRMLPVRHIQAYDAMNNEWRYVMFRISHPHAVDTPTNGPYDSTAKDERMTAKWIKAFDPTTGSWTEQAFYI